MAATLDLVGNSFKGEVDDTERWAKLLKHPERPVVYQLPNTNGEPDQRLEFASLYALAKDLGRPHISLHEHVQYIFPNWEETKPFIKDTINEPPLETSPTQITVDNIKDLLSLEYDVEDKTIDLDDLTTDEKRIIYKVVRAIRAGRSVGLDLRQKLPEKLEPHQIYQSQAKTGCVIAHLNKVFGKAGLNVLDGYSMDRARLKKLDPTAWQRLSNVEKTFDDQQVPVDDLRLPTVPVANYLHDAMRTELGVEPVIGEVGRVHRCKNRNKPKRLQR